MWQKALENIGLDTCKETAIDRIIGPIYGNPICMSSTIISRILPCLNYPHKTNLTTLAFCFVGSIVPILDTTKSASIIINNNDFPYLHKDTEH